MTTLLRNQFPNNNTTSDSLQSSLRPSECCVYVSERLHISQAGIVEVTNVYVTPLVVNAKPGFSCTQHHIEIESYA